MIGRVAKPCLCAVVFLVAVMSNADMVLAQWVPTSPESAVARVNSMLKTRPWVQTRDSVVFLLFSSVVQRMSWKQQDLFTLGRRITEKDDGFFLGHLLKGFYLANVAVDRRGHMEAKTELKKALEQWPVDKYKPYKGNMDALTTSQYLAGVSTDEQVYSYYLTYGYLWLYYQLCEEYLELNEAALAYELMDALAKQKFAYDLYSGHKLAWMFYKYRYFHQGRNYPFLKGSMLENVRTALDMSFRQKKQIDAYRAQKAGNFRYWLDEPLLQWYTSTADNVISIAYGVIWEVDSSITYFERIPYSMQIRNNGTYTYLAAINFRAAERQFELEGKPYGTPLSVLDDPTAIESYKNMLIYKGTPEEAYFYLDNYAKKYQRDRGWARIWMGTINYWNGHLDESLKNLRAAREYPEVFGNISFNRTHYDAMTLAQLSATCDAQIHRLDFEPNLEEGFLERIWNAVKKFFLKLYYAFMSFIYRHYSIGMYLEIEDRPEYLKIFYPENVMDYHQTWTIIKSLDADWHLEHLRDARAHDKRRGAEKYYSFFEAGLLHELGNDEEAMQVLNGSGRPIESEADTTYEKLLIAMTEDLNVHVIDETGKGDRLHHLVGLYQIYPQAVFLWGHKLPLSIDLQTIKSTDNDDQRMVDNVIGTFEDFGFDFRHDPSPDIPSMSIRPVGTGLELAFEYAVSVNGRVIASGRIASTETKAGVTTALKYREIAKRLAYGVFRMTTSHEEDTGTGAQS